MKTLISVLLALSIQPCFADQAAPTQAAPVKSEASKNTEEELAAPAATSVTTLQVPKSSERNTIILGSGALGAGIGFLMAGSITDHDNKYNELTFAALGGFIGLAAGTYFGLKFYPPVVAVKETSNDRTTSVHVRFDY